MAGERPEITFGSNVAVWKNSYGRSITIKPRQYQDKEGNWKTANNWNVSDVAHLAHCLLMALDYSLHERASEERLKLHGTPPATPEPPKSEPPPQDGPIPF